MNYSKPELAVIGDANSMIRGSKNAAAEPDPTKPLAASFELED